MKGLNGVEITELRDDIFRLSPDISNCMVIWIDEGFSGLKADFEFNFLDKDCRYHEIFRISTGERINKSNTYNIVSNLPANSVFSIFPALHNMTHFYLYPNPGLHNIDYFRIEEAVKDFVLDALNQMDLFQFESISMNGIMGRDTTGAHSESVDRDISRIMLATIESWLKHKGSTTSLKKIWLITKSPFGFGLRFRGTDR